MLLFLNDWLLPNQWWCGRGLGQPRAHIVALLPCWCELKAAATNGRVASEGNFTRIRAFSKATSKWKIHIISKTALRIYFLKDEFEQSLLRSYFPPSWATSTKYELSRKLSFHHNITVEGKDERLWKASDEPIQIYLSDSLTTHKGRRRKWLRPNTEAIYVEWKVRHHHWHLSGNEPHGDEEALSPTELKMLGISVVIARGGSNVKHHLQMSLTLVQGHKEHILSSLRQPIAYQLCMYLYLGSRRWRRIFCEFLGLISKVRGRLGLQEFMNSELKIALRILHRSAKNTQLTEEYKTSSAHLPPFSHLPVAVHWNHPDALTSRRQMSTALSWYYFHCIPLRMSCNMHLPDSTFHFFRDEMPTIPKLPSPPGRRKCN